MRLRDMNAEQLCDALCSLTQPLCSLAEDPAVQAALDTLLAAELTKLPPARAWAMLTAALTPLLLRDHRSETLAVAAVLLDRPADALRADNGLHLLAALRDCWDEELIDFFASAAGTADKPCSPCSAAAMGE